MNRISILFHFIGILTILCSCGNSESPNIRNLPQLRLSLIDAPAVYDEVNIDIVQVMASLSQTDDDDSKEWVDISDFNPGIVDILSLVNGKELKLVDRPVSFDYIDEVRLILGPKNSLVIGGKKVELKVPSGSSSGLKIKFEKNIETGEKYDFLLDFDAAMSIKQAGKSGKYLLKPVIRVKSKSETGGISGQVLPAKSGITAYAILDTDSVSTVTDTDGKFLLRGLDQDIYKVSVKNNGKTIRKLTVQVRTGKISDAGVFDFN